jgi:hypothetical protein
MPKTFSAIRWGMALSALVGISLFAAGCSTSRGAEPIKISAALPAGVVASGGEGAYMAQLSATGGTAPYTFTITSAPNTFPAGLTMAADGSITGMPTTKGTYNFTVEATDSQGHKASTPARIYIYTGTNPHGLL